MTARAEIAPVGNDPAAEIDCPADIEHPIALVAEPVNAGLGPQRGHGRRPIPPSGPHCAYFGTGRRHLAHPTADRTSQRMRLALV
jgi:hypothetical protein